MYVLVAALLAAFWKLLGKLCWPLLRAWISKGPSLGFLSLVSLSETHLRAKGLDAITKALSNSLPFTAAQVEVGDLALSLGFIVGVRLRARNVTVVLQRKTSHWPEEELRSAASSLSASAAKSSLGLVAKAQNPKPPMGIFARVAEMFIAGTHVSVDDLRIVFQDSSGEEELSIGLNFHLQTQRSWKIEFRGTHVSADAELSLRAGGEELLAPTRATVRAELPKVLRTLLVPKPMPKKTALADVSVGGIHLLVRPKSVLALMKISDTMTRFSEWAKEVTESEEKERMPLTAVELQHYLDAVRAKQRDLAEWEQRMSAKEILNARYAAENWPIPQHLNLEEWLDQLKDEQRPLRSLKAEVTLEFLHVEALQNGETPGMGCSAQLKDLKLSGAMLDTDLIAHSRSEACLLASCEADSRMPKMKATLKLQSFALECEPANTQAASVLRPCRWDLSFAKYPASSGEELQLKLAAQGEPGLVATVSSRALWRLQQAAAQLREATEAAKDPIPKGASSASVTRRSSPTQRHTDTHLEKVRSLFQRLDVDHSGTLEPEEVKDLLESMYGQFMTPKELDIATEHLMHHLAGNTGHLSFEDLQGFFQRERGDTAEQDQVCLKLHELTTPLPEMLQVEKLWEELLDSTKTSKSYNSSSISASTLQLYWVRTLENYQEAKRLWQERLEPRVEERLKRWRLRGSMPLVDFWSDPAISSRALPIGAKEQDLTVYLEICMDGFTVRLSDTQHASSVPRAKLELSDVSLQGGLFRAHNSGFEAMEGLRARLQLRAEYWNQSLRVAEPFLEPWNLHLEASPSLLSVRAEEHLVLNITPPLMQALTVALNSLASAKETQDKAFDQLAQTGAPVAVWVFNSTLCDVRVAVRNPAGARSAPVEISRWDFREPVALYLAADSDAPLSVGTSSRWVLEMQLRGGDMDNAKTGQGWWVREELPFSTTGRRVIPVGHRHLCVSFSVDVRSLAPIVALSGVGLLQNMTSRPLSVSLGELDGEAQQVEVPPYQTWKAGIGGGYEVSMPLDKRGQFKMKLPLDSEPLDEREKLLDRFAGYRFVLLAHEGKLRKGELRDRAVVCVPMLSVLNALPCEFECSVRNVRKTKRRRRHNQFLMAGDPSEQGQRPHEAETEEVQVEEAHPAHTQPLCPGERLGFNEVDPDLAVEVAVRFAGFEYSALVPAKSLKSRAAVHRARAARASATSRFDLSEHGLCLQSEDPSAPLLEVDLEWEMHGAVFFVYSRYWIADKTGWGLDLWSEGSDHMKISEQAQAVPVPATGAWQPQTSEDNQTPHLALMHLHSEQIDLRLLEGGCKNLAGWYWRPGSGEQLTAWWGSKEADEPEADTPEVTGWSGPLSVGILGSTGVAALPAAGLLSSMSSPTAEVGVAVTGVPAPFERTKLVTVVPRYLVRNQLPHALEIWPSRGSSKQAPHAFAHLIGTWRAEDLEFSLVAAEDALQYQRTTAEGDVVGTLTRQGPCLVGEVTQGGSASGEVRLRVLQDTLHHSTRDAPECDWENEVSTHSKDASVARNPALAPGATMSIGAIPQPDSWALSSLKDSALVPLVSFRLREDETRWSNQVPLSAVGDTICALSHLDGGPPLLVRASVQLEGATLFLVLSEGQWPFEIENRSFRHTVHEEWVMRPCEVRRFVFPDPEQPKTLVGRILGAGETQAAWYQLDNISAGGAQHSLWVPGTSSPALDTTLLLRGVSRRLVLCDRESTNSEADWGHDDVTGHQDQAAVLNRMAFDFFLSGLHVCLADTLHKVAEELLGLTVDYIQVEKPANERILKLTVHHMQLDDFGDEASFLFGPMDSGLNSRTSAVADAEDFSSVPLLSLMLEGPGDRSTHIFDAAHRAITLKNFILALRPLEARVDVPRVLYIASRLKEWTASLEQPGNADAIGLLDRVLMTGFRTPTGGELTCSLGLLQAQAVWLNLEVKLTKRRGDVKEDQEDGGSEMALQLRKQFSRFGALQPIIEFFARLGASFADVAPRFRFSPLLISDASAALPVLQSAVTRHYIQQLLQQSARLLGSLQLLGDPANLMDEIGSGVMSFFSKTKQEVLGQRAGLGSGVTDLTESIVGGALQSFAKMSGSLKDTVGSSLGQPIGSDRKAASVREGLDLGYASIAVGLAEGISSVIKEPFKQANEDGLIGLASGTALGAASAVVRPLEGLLGAVEKLAQDCIDKVENRFELVLLAAHRARMISSGSPLTIDRDNDKNPVVALREIAEQTVSPEDMKEDLIHSLQKFVEVDEPETEAVPVVPSANQHQVTQVNNVDDGAVEFDRMSEEDLLRGLEGLVPPERTDDV
ncbi:unnamed protein product [Effrenium voratum]|uniref:DNA-directed RNA polymerase n=1 Tax=Effrenium voratum TaxID=2562239 RepID=A0AA36NFL2_9DINO|nr:unnamed protein product [Effrenium voratum]